MVIKAASCEISLRTLRALEGPDFCMNLLMKLKVFYVSKAF
jgi:hypothetical protein